MSPILLLAAFVLFAMIMYDFVTGRPTRNSPPGLLRWPIAGSYLQILWDNYTHTHKALSMYTKRYKSPLVSFYLGQYYCMVANSYETCKEVFTKPEFQGRPDTFPFRVRSYGKRLGIFFDDGEHWLIQRRFTMRELRDFGLGRRYELYEGVVEEEIKSTLDTIRTSQVQPLPDVFYKLMVNSILYLLTGQRLDNCQMQKIQQFSKDSLKFIRSGDPTGAALTFAPWVRHFIPNISGYTDLLCSNEGMQGFVGEIIEENNKDLETDSGRGFIDVYMNSKEEYKHFSDEQLRLVCTDMLLPSNTISQLVSLVLVHLSKHQEIQERCQRQLDDVVGIGRLLNLCDREHLPMLEATIREVVRLETLVPLAVPHQATENTTLYGYDVPKYTVVFTNVWYVNRDPDVFPEPDKFKPERYLDRRGNLIKKDPTLAFGIGKRVCPGETFSRQNIFLTVSAVLQNFTVVEDKILGCEERHPGAVLSLPDDFTIKFIPRI